jgi:hypothetical protein
MICAGGEREIRAGHGQEVGAAGGGVKSILCAVREPPVAARHDFGGNARPLAYAITHFFTPVNALFVSSSRSAAAGRVP